MAEYQITDEEREARRQRALALHKQVDPVTGRRRFGGPQPGSGRPRKKRAAEMVAEAAQDEAKEITKVFKDLIDAKSPPAIRLAAAREWLAVENKEAELQLKEERSLAEMNHEELLDKVAGALAGLAENGHLDGPLGEMFGQAVQNGTVVTLTEDQYEMVDGSAEG